MRRRIVTAAGVITTGLCVGWLMGLSSSPVAQAVITALLGLVAALATFVLGSGSSAPSGTTTAPQRLTIALQSVGLTLIAGLAVSIVVGGSVGLYARTHDWLGLNADEDAATWATRLGIGKREVFAAMFKARMSSESKKDESQSGRGVLFSEPQGQQVICGTTNGLDARTLRRRLALMDDARLREVAADNSISDDFLKTLVEKVICR